MPVRLGAPAVSLCLCCVSLCPQRQLSKSPSLRARYYCCSNRTRGAQRGATDFCPCVCKVVSCLSTIDRYPKVNHRESRPPSLQSTVGLDYCAGDYAEDSSSIGKHLRAQSVVLWREQQHGGDPHIHVRDAEDSLWFIYVGAWQRAGCLGSCLPRC